MKKNVGGIDRALRAIIGVAVIGAGLYFGSWWGLVGIVLVATAAIGWCPPYSLLGINTCNVK